MPLDRSTIAIYKLTVVCIQIFHCNIEQAHCLEKSGQIIIHKIFFPKRLRFLKAVFCHKVTDTSFIEYDSFVLQVVECSHNGIWIYFYTYSHFPYRRNTVSRVPLLKQNILTKVICYLQINCIIVSELRTIPPVLLVQDMLSPSTKGAVPTRKAKLSLATADTLPFLSGVYIQLKFRCQNEISLS